MANHRNSSSSTSRRSSSDDYYHANLKTVVRIVEGALFEKSDLSPDQDLMKNLEYSRFLDLYKIAERNKIALLFLQSVMKITEESLRIHNFMKEELQKQMVLYADIEQTMLRAAQILNSTACKYAIIKSKFPFPVVPNDVDVLVFGGKDEYLRTSRNMEKRGFVLLGKAPLECCLHDSLRGIHDDPEIKDAFDVDLYREIGAGHVIYMNIERVSPYVHEEYLNSTRINMLDLPLEIALSIFHSIYPERIFTLLHYFQLTYAVKRMSRSDKILFLQVCRDNKMEKAASIVFGLVEQLQQLCTGFIDPSVSSLTDSLGRNSRIDLVKLPYVYPMKTVLDTFWAKKTDMTFSLSLSKQAIFMLNPRYAKYVFRVFRDRSKRDTY